MIYVLFPQGDLGWDDLRVFTTFGAAEAAVTPYTFIVAFEGTDELKPVWVYRMERGTLRRYPVSRSP